MALHNVKRLKDVRKKLRSSLTPAETALWKQLQNAQIEGKKFRRQHSIGPYVVDFYCVECKLAIELDGDGHFFLARDLKDTERTEYLASKDVRVLRFENKEIFQNLDFVLETIKRNLLPPRLAKDARHPS
jgi:very-short-patch-repair endonuclease